MARDTNRYHLKQLGETVLNARQFSVVAFAACAFFLFSVTNAAAQKSKNSTAIPDFLRGDKIPQGYDHDWNLGPTGARGWIYTKDFETSEARQILITEVQKGSPADRVLQTGDVILGVGGAKFSYDPRTEFGKGIASAEASKGKLELEVWRKGMTSQKTLKLKVMSSYSDTAPFDCRKSKRIFERGCVALARQMQARPKAGNEITRSLNTLALLSSGQKKFMPIIKEQVKRAAKYSDVKGKNLCSWFYGPTNLLLAEYTLATGDKTYLPDLKRISLEIVAGQSRIGSWGHRFAYPNGRLQGYGMMNAPGLPIMLSLVLAKKAGVDDPRLDEAIEQSTRLIRFYVGKGSVPYGDHEPWIKSHDDNGKNGIAALLFNAMGEQEPAEYFSRMGVASYGHERELGHTGNYLNILWAMPAVALSGPQATGAWMEEFSWYYDLARRWDGTFRHQGPAQASKDSFKNWDSTGAILLAYAQPLKKLYITGKASGVVTQVDKKTAASLIEDGRGYRRGKNSSTYSDRTDQQLLKSLTSWSPVVRQRAADALSKRKGNYYRQLAKMLKSNLYSRLGACQALAKMGKRTAPAVPALRKALRHKDLWLRIKAAQALAAAGPESRVAIPELLQMLAAKPTADDPRGMQQRYLSFVLFDQRKGMLKMKKSLAGVDRRSLYKAVRAGLENEGGRARSAIATVYKNLSYEEIKPLLPAIYRATVEPAPSGIMFADGVRLSGMELLAKHNIREGVPLCVDLIEMGHWGIAKRIPRCFAALESYGGAAKSEIEKLKLLQKDLAAKPKKSEKDQKLIQQIEQLIRQIKSDNSKPVLRSLPKNQA